MLPVVAGLARHTRARVSIDTMKLAVAEAAVDAGATYVNDVTRLPRTTRTWPGSSPTAAWTAA